MKTEYYALNRDRKTVTRIEASCWEEMQMRAIMGIVMPDNRVANGIGRCKTGELEKRAKQSGYVIL